MLVEFFSTKKWSIKSCPKDIARTIQGWVDQCNEIEKNLEDIVFYSGVFKWYLNKVLHVNTFGDEVEYWCVVDFDSICNKN